jgi:hypothetical protein
MSMEMKLARLENRVARMEKEAMLKKIKQAIVKVVRGLGLDLEKLKKAVQGADEHEIQREIERMRKHPDFNRVMKNAPRRGGIKKLWGYFSIYLKRLGVHALHALPMAIFLTAWAMNYKFVEAQPQFLFFGLLVPFLNLVIDEEFEDIAEEDYYAREIAKQRLLNER